MLFSNFSLFFLVYWLISLALSQSLLHIAICWVGVNICLYVLFSKGSLVSLEVCLKYFLSSTAITCTLYFAILIYYSLFGTFTIAYFNYNYLGHSSLDSLGNVPFLLKTAFTFIFSAIFFKLGAFPFNYYVADIYQSLSWRTNMYVYTVTLKLAVFVLLCKVLFWTSCIASSFVYPLITFSGIGSVFLGAYGLVSEDKIKRFFAQSYIVAIGFVFLGFGVTTTSSISIIAMKFYFIVYILTWSGILHFFDTTKLKNKDGIHLEFVELNHLKSISYRFFTHKEYSLLLLVISLMGLPMSLGFLAKCYVYTQMLQSGYGALVFASTLVMTPMVSYGYLRLVIKLFTPSQSNIYKLAHINSNYVLTVTMSTVICVIVPGVFAIFAILDHVIFVADRCNLAYFSKMFNTEFLPRNYYLRSHGMLKYYICAVPVLSYYSLIGTSL